MNYFNSSIDNINILEAEILYRLPSTRFNLLVSIEILESCCFVKIRHDRKVNYTFNCTVFGGKPTLTGSEQQKFFVTMQQSHGNW